MKNRNAKVLSALMGAAVMPVLASLSASSASAGIILNVTDLGAITNAGTGVNAATYTGYEAYDVSLSTDDGGLITAVNFGTTAADPLGIFYTGTSGGFLQLANYNAGTATSTTTPQNAAKNDTGTNLRSSSFDTHMLPAASVRVDVAAPFENYIAQSPQPIPGSNTHGDTTTGTDFGLGTYLHGTFAINGANQATSLDLAYIVVPTPAGATSGHFTVNGSVAESTSQTAIPVAGTFPTAVTGGGPVISLLATNTGVSATPLVGTSNPGVTGINPVGNATAGYVKGELNSIVTGKTGSTEVRFQGTLGGTTTDPGIEYIGLNLADTGNLATDEAALIADINGVAGFTAIASTGSLSADQQSALNAMNFGHGAGFYDVLISHSSVGGGDGFLGLDLSQDSSLGTLSVTDIAAVPEPASVMGLLVGASGLLMGRRKRKA